MAKITEMTQLSPTMAEGTIVKWIKKTGDSVQAGDVMAEVETDKAVMEMEAYESGTLLHIVAQEGTKVKVGGPVAIVGKSGEDISQLLTQVANLNASAPASSAPAPSAPPPPTPTPSPVSQPEPVAKKQEPASPPPEKKMEPAPIPVSGNRILASPLAKAYAVDKGITLKGVIGSGPGGRILKKDLIQSQQTQTISPSVQKKDQSIPLSGMRKTIARRLWESKQHIPHFYLNTEIDAERMVEFREKLNSDLQATSAEPIKVSLNDLIIKAVSRALIKVPAVNASFNEEQIMIHGNIDIGMAVSIDGGLLTPVIRNADLKSVIQIAKETKSLATRARERKLKPDEFTGSSFTISNLGMFGIESFSAIINEPESAILAVGGLIEKPVIKNGTIVPGKTIKMTMSCDHRSVDGALGAQFLQELKKILESPFSLLE
jgi:pyruvate dehydrogenase E2 component (dihydrolipoamide acetyltransferase)